ncbi:hypothetical protein BaRGS_00029752 [Batillaria attramentaria]|uniref:Uncharacterized protein n=1 Tax=Batillaria attramentaria TaxID=370345 RepID=A0ABD0JWC4_9CAEN
MLQVRWYGQSEVRSAVEKVLPLVMEGFCYDVEGRRYTELILGTSLDHFSDVGMCNMAAAVPILLVLITYKSHPPPLSLISLRAGPATVRMVSSNGPPVPMPMQVPPGHMVQQIVDEHGILTHVILSPQPPMPGAPMTVGYYVCIIPSFLFQLPPSQSHADHTVNE